MKTRETVRRWAFLVVAAFSIVTAGGMWMIPETRRVPIERITANIERKLALTNSESARLQTGEVFFAWSSDSRIKGAHTIDDSGNLTLTKAGTIKAAGKTLLELESDLERWL